MSTHVKKNANHANSHSDAGVDVAMVYYFFGKKEGLFNAAVIDIPGHPVPPTRRHVG